MSWSKVSGDFTTNARLTNYQLLTEEPRELLRHLITRLKEFPNPKINSIEYALQEECRKTLQESWKKKTLSDYHLIKWIFFDPMAPKSEVDIDTALNNIAKEIDIADVEDWKLFHQAFKVSSYVRGNETLFNASPFHHLFLQKIEITLNDQTKYKIDKHLALARFQKWREKFSQDRSFFDHLTLDVNTREMELLNYILLSWKIVDGEVVYSIPKELQLEDTKQILALYSKVKPLGCTILEEELATYLCEEAKEKLNEILAHAVQHNDRNLMEEAIYSINRLPEGKVNLNILVDQNQFGLQFLIFEWTREISDFFKPLLFYLWDIAFFGDASQTKNFLELTKEIDLSHVKNVKVSVQNPYLQEIKKKFPNAKLTHPDQSLLKRKKINPEDTLLRKCDSLSISE